MLFRALAFATFLASSAAADNDSFLRGDRLLGKPAGGGNLGGCKLPGNGFPSGNPAFRLNLLGKTKDIDYKAQGGNNIVIRLDEKCKGKNGDNCSESVNTKITLYNSDTNDICTEDFEVVDPNGADADGEAGLCLPDPFEDSDPCIDGEGSTCATEALYAVYARVRGKGKLNFNTCATDGTETWCSVGVAEVLPKRAVDISQELLTLCIDADGDGEKDDGVGLFDKIDGEEVGYFWDVTNDGVRNAEFRFYTIQDLIAACKGDMECEKCYAGVTRGDAC